MDTKSAITIEDRNIQIVENHEFEKISDYELRSLSLKWSVRSYPESHGKIYKVLGLFDELAFVSTENSILGIDYKNGEIKWHVKGNSNSFKLDKKNKQLVNPEYNITSGGEVLKRKIIGLPKGKENSLAFIRDNSNFVLTPDQMFFSSTVQNLRFGYCYLNSMSIDDNKIINSIELNRGKNYRDIRQILKYKNKIYAIDHGDNLHIIEVENNSAHNKGSIP